MATYTMTFQEVLDSKQVFYPQQIVDYENLQEDIKDQFFEREINYATPDAFIRKFNHKLRILAPNYNKMVASEMIQFEPLITEFITDDKVGRENTNTENSQKAFTSGHNSTENKSDGMTRNESNQAANNAESGSLSAIESKLIKNLLSETERQESSREYEETGDQYIVADKDGTSDETRHTTGTVDTTEGTTWSEDGTDESHSQEDTEWGENGEEHSTTVQGETWDESGEKHTDVTGKVTKQNTTDKTDNQTGGDWTEKGDNANHGLDVASDTPNAMLFNTPPNTAVYGTGRSHYEGEVTNIDGRTGTTDFPEAGNIDSANISMGSSDSPWFNYATGANNSIGHSTYSKSGTQSYNRDGNETSNGTEEKTEGTDEKYSKWGKKDTNTEVNSNYSKDGTKGVTTETTSSYHKEGKKDVTTHTDTTEDMTDQLKTHEDSSESTVNSKGGIENQNSGKANNRTEDGKQDGMNKQSYKSTSVNQNIGVTVGTEGRNATGIQKYNEDTANSGNTKTATENSEKTIRRGRSQRSPSKLLMEYRDTLTFNAKRWLFSELEACFLQVY